MADKYVTPSDDYVCTLSPETQSIAKLELTENDFTRRQALESLRLWINQNPRILRCRFDSNFLLKFLRFKKFSMTATEETLERYLLLRQTYGQGLRKLDIMNSRMMELLDNGIAFPLPGRDYLGRRVMLIRGGIFDPYKYTNEDALRITGIMCETLMLEEENQVRGLVYIGDGAGVGFPHLTLFTPREAVRIVKNGERTIPVRHKEAHGINVLPSLKFAIDFGFSLIPEKFKKRIKIYSKIDEFYENIDKSMLPKEYGGTIPMSEMIASWKKELLEARDQLLLNDEMSVNLDMFSEKAKIGAVSALKHGGSCIGNNKYDLELIGSFKKLEVD